MRFSPNKRKIFCPLSAMTESPDDAVVGVHSTARIASWNKGARKIFGFTKKEALGKRLHHLVIPKHAHADFSRVLVKTKNSEYSCRHVTRCIGKNGKEISAVFRLLPLKNNSHKSPCIVTVIHDITVRKKIENELYSNFQRISLAIGAAAIGIWELNTQTKEACWNKKLLEMFGFYPTKKISYERWLGLIHPEDSPNVKRCLRKIIRNKTLCTFEFRINRANDGALCYIQVSAQIVTDKSGKTTGIVGTTIDVTNQKNAENELKNRLEIEKIIGETSKYVARLTTDNIDCGIKNVIAKISLHMNFEHSSIFIFSADGKTMVNAYNWKLAHSQGSNYIPCTLISHLRKMILQKSIVAVPDVNKLNANHKQEKKELLKYGVKTFVCIPLVVNNETTGFWGLCSSRPKKTLIEYDLSLLTAFGEIIVGMLERKKADENLTQLATFDSLTYLPNRFQFEKNISQCLAHARRHRQKFTLFLIDLDNFKDINDTYGHDIGDLLLKEVGTRLSSCVRKEDFVGHLGGDEFVIITDSVKNHTTAANVAQKIINTVRSPYKARKRQIFTTASVGIVCFPEDGSDRLTLFKHADKAVYKAKRHGRNNYQFYDKLM